MNRLAGEASPYLLQHANNPVDWWPWCEEALAEARRRDVPILLSIGYSACHWCHVMEHESFSDPAIAAQMNEKFVCIKVDREERPDLDQIYQLVVQVLGRNGGWPLTVFLTPSQAPFYGGTYFPPVDRYGMPGLPSILDAVADTWRDKRDDVVAQSKELTSAIAEIGRAETKGEGKPGPDVIVLGPGRSRVFGFRANRWVEVGSLSGVRCSGDTEAIGRGDYRISPPVMRSGLDVNGRRFLFEEARKCPAKAGKSAAVDDDVTDVAIVKPVR